MKQTYLLFLLPFLHFLFVPNPTVLAQDRTGNIVEYFGKEKIDDIHEGELVHVFDEALVLPLNIIGNRSATFPDHPIFKEFLLHPDKIVKENQVFDVDYLGNEMTWQPLQTDSTSTFQDQRLRSGYLFLEYDSPTEETLIFEGSGHTQVLINGLPQEGDHYDFGWSLIPIRVNKGVNTFVLSSGRFNRMRARLIRPESPVMFTPRDLLLPDLLIEESDRKFLGAVRILNTTNQNISGYSIRCKLGNLSSETPIRTISPRMVQKVPFLIPFDKSIPEGDREIKLELHDPQGNVISTHVITIAVKSNQVHHKRTFISRVDSSVQYFSVAPSTNPQQDSQALFLSVHGASVEAVNQANAYSKKDWGYLVAPTNRRPFGFAWEDWGRIDALEVLQEAENIYRPHPQKIYLTGHSMGGHGTWYLGATYPDKFAAIAPCAGYPDLLEYRNSYIERRFQQPIEVLERAGISRKTVERMLMQNVETPIDKMILRSGNTSRTLRLIRNYLQSGVYILHGEKDNVVPTYLARDMRERLGRFHPDFVYYEYPDGTHWYGDHSVDWPPIFDFFKQRTIPLNSEVDDFEFHTASPGVSSRSHFIEIHQQHSPLDISHVDVHRMDSLDITTANVAALSIDLTEMGGNPQRLILDGQPLDIPRGRDKIYLRKSAKGWQFDSEFPRTEKGPHRYGGFKDAFNNEVVLVYGTGGNQEENEWYFNRASFDAQKFWYRANGHIPVISDADFDPNDYPDRNVILYGNKSNNQAWEAMLAECPIQISDDQVKIGEVTLTGDQWGTYFIYPRTDSETASIGVVSATGIRGMKAAFNNVYLENGSMFPDFLLFDETALTRGNDGVKCAGFFSNNWTVEAGDFEWK